MLLGELERRLGAAGLGRGASGRVLVACSGGVDSVALAAGTVELLGARRVVLGHVDHGVRPDSQEDARSVDELGEMLGAETRSVRVEPPSADEDTLRQARYAALFAMREAAGAAALLMGHTLDDQAETVLMALISSSRASSLSGIPRERGPILRPLLGVPRSEVVAYAVRRGLRWREDATNSDPRYLRNRVRRELLPLLESRYRPGLRGRLAALAEEISGQRRLPQNVERASGVVTHTWPSIVIMRAPWTGEPLPDGRKKAVFDASALAAPTVRPWAPGDRIRPFGLEGRRKVADVLSEAGVPREARRGWPVVEEGGEVVWVSGLLRSGRAPVGPATREVWIFEQKRACDTVPEGPL